MREKITISLTDHYRSVIDAHGPYALRKDGVLLDRDGIALCSLRPHPESEEAEWDRAVVQALNEIASAKR